MESSKSKSSKQLTEWTVEDVSQIIREQYNDEVAKKFEEQRIDGKALKLLAKDGNATQFSACGLSTVGDQMRLKEIASGIPLVIGRNRKKPSVAEMRTLTDLNQRIYKAKRKAVSNAALEKWPGNNLPVFKNDPAATKELETLVSTLEETCSFEPAGFNREGIHQHILDVLGPVARSLVSANRWLQGIKTHRFPWYLTLVSANHASSNPGLNERRRRIRKGHDYTKPDKRTIKKLKVSSSSSELEASGAEDEGGDTDILSSSSSDKDESYENEEDLSLQGAKLIITVMFSAIKYGDVSKQQLVSGAKKFKLSCNTSSKDSMALALAKTFVKENFIKINSPNLRDFTRDKVQKFKVY